MTTTNFQLIDICRKVNLPLVGVYNKDTLPKKRKHGCYIINLEDDYDHETGEDLGGTHWVGFIIHKNMKKALYFDSFGFPAPESVKRFLKPYSTMYSMKHIQNINSSTCGMYVIGFFIFNLKHVWNLEQFVNMFSDDVKDNNQILENYLKRYQIEIY